MATTSTNLSLRKPAGSDTVNVTTDLSDNFELIDDAFDSTTPSTQAIGDSASAGSTVKAARVDHKHAMPAFGAISSVGTSNDNGAATTIARSDHVHDLGADSIDSGTLVADDVIDSEHIAAGAIDLEHMSANSVDSDQYVDGSIDTIHLADLAVTDGKVATANKDGASSTASMRTLGTGATQAAAGNHTHSTPATNFDTAVGAGTDTTTSSSYSTLDEMTATVTTTGGNLLVIFSGSFRHTDQDALVRIGVQLDSATTVDKLEPEAGAGNATFCAMFVHVFTSVSAASHDVHVRWLTDASTASSEADRYLYVQELPV